MCELLLDAFRVSANYTNVPRLWLSIVKDDAKRNTRRGYRDQDDLKRVLALPALREWNVELPDDGDLNGHLVELPLEPLPIGGYSIIASDRSLADGTGLIVITPVQATRLSMAERTSAKGRPGVLVMDRETGTPLVGAKAELFQELYKNGGLQDVTLGTAITDAYGMAEVVAPLDRPGQQHWVITYGKERLATPGNYYYRNYDEGVDRDTIRTFLFTDRAIYRPGQPVTLSVDMYPGTTLKGTVDSIGAGSGAVFSLLPPQNATGNWVKVTQRFSVRIKIDTKPDDPALQLRVGASVSATVDTTAHDVAK